MKTLNKQIQPQDSRKHGKVSYATKEELWEAIFNICESTGAINHVDDDFYNIFLNLSEKQMIIIIKTIIRDNAKSINKICFDPNRKDEGRDKDIYELINETLDWIARGIMGFNDDTHGLGFSKPVGNPPDSVMEEKIRQKIEDSKPLITKAFNEVFEEQKKQHS